MISSVPAIAPATDAETGVAASSGAAANTLAEARKSEIRALYELVKAGLPGFRPRAAQGRMIAAVARALAGGGGAGAIEAPTGTGKSMAYLVAGLPLAQAADRTLIISTATIALQEQLVERDVPQFLRLIGSDARVVLAKGRQRYACVRNLAELTGGGNNAAQEGFDFAGELPVAGWPRPPQPGEADDIAMLLAALQSGEWNGDIDQPPLPIEEQTRPLLTTSAGGCSNRRCPHIVRCPFVLARNRLREADIVVANHDLVLADLLLGADEDGSGGVLLPAPQESLYVFDEAHHLASKAISRGAAEVALNEALRRLSRLAGPLRAAFGLSDKQRIGRLSADQVDDALADLESGLDAMTRAITRAWVPRTTEEAVWRAPLGRLPEDFAQHAQGLSETSGKLARWLPSALKAVLESEVPNERREALARELGMARERLEQQHALWWLWALDDDGDYAPTARWISQARDGGLVCHASSVSAAPLLRRVLWKQAAGVVLTSATLSAGGDFRAFAAEVGLPDEAETLALDSPFDLPRQARLEVPPIQPLPNEHEAHVAAIAAWLDAELDFSRGNLVLFTSRRKLADTLAALPPARQSVVRAQGAMGKAALLAAHAEAIGAGRGSTLFGLASFGEGLDLPGRLCETVVVTQLPFAVPTDPVGATYAEWLESRGRNAFVEVSIPQATRTLVQYCGRLIRNEDDVGRIVILDRRILVKGYGPRMLRALPPFARVFG